MSGTGAGLKTIQRGWLGRWLGLPPKVYVCHGRDGVWREEHEGPLWYIGGVPGVAIPCLNCEETTGIGVDVRCV